MNFKLYRNWTFKEKLPNDFSYFFAIRKYSQGLKIFYYTKFSNYLD